MTQTLLIGNGLNRCNVDSVAWDTLISDIASERNLDVCVDVPLPLEFEALCRAEGLKSSNANADIFNELKHIAAEKIQSGCTESTNLHRAFASLRVDSILTTNYDLSLEKSLGADCSNAVTKNSTKYLRQKTGFYDEKSFYHIHGWVNDEKTICLGYEHYAGYIKTLRSELLKNGTLNGSLMTDDKWRDKGYWPILFFKSDVHIVGLALEYSEIDLWWLLTLRSSLQASGKLSPDTNRIFFYKLSGALAKGDDAEKLNRLSMLEKLGVEVIRVPASSYEKGYESIAAQIETYISTNR